MQVLHAVPPLVSPFFVARGVREAARAELHMVWDVTDAEARDLGDSLHVLAQRLPAPVQRAAGSMAEVLPVFAAVGALIVATNSRVLMHRELMEQYRQAARPAPPQEQPASPGAAYSRLT